MKKKLSFLFAAAFAALTCQAQVVAYDVEASTVDYQEISDGTVIDLQGTVGKELSKLLLDADGNMHFAEAENVHAFPISFSFPFNGKQMKYFLLTSDGCVLLYDQEYVSTSVHVVGYSSPAFELDGDNSSNAFGAIPREGTYGYEDTEISYKVEGSSGKRVLIIQYKNLGIQSGAWDTDVMAKAQLQYRLYEETGNISMHLNGWQPFNGVSTGNYNWMRVGITGDAKDLLQLEAYDASQLSQRSTSISYTAQSYPADGTMWTFKAPEECTTPLTPAGGLELNSTSTQINGSVFMGDADYYLVLLSTENALSQTPEDGTKYAVGDALGNATVAAILTQTTTQDNKLTFETADDLTPGATYYVTVIAYNGNCLNGPKYLSTFTAAKVDMKPGAPTGMYFGSVDKANANVYWQANTKVLVAISSEQGTDRWGDPAPYGQFGTPTGTYNVGDEIADGGKVVYIGNDMECSLSNLEAGKAYFVRAWGIDENGNYSTVYTEENFATTAELPWVADFDNTIGYEAFLPGWTKSSTEDWTSTSDRNDNWYIYNRNVVGQTYVTTPNIELGYDKAHIMFSIGGSQGSGWMSSDWTMADDEYVTLQVINNGEPIDVLKITGAALSKSTMKEYEVFVEDEMLKGKTVQLRVLFNRSQAGEVQLGSLSVENYAGDVYGIMGTIPGLTWDNDLFMEKTDDEGIFVATLGPVEIEELPEQAYEYKMRANQNWDGTQLPEGPTNYSWMPTETGTYYLTFVLDMNAKTLYLQVERPFYATFDNKGGWGEVYAYTFSRDPETGDVTEQSGPWPGTQVTTTTGWGMNRSYRYDFVATEAPQFIIFSNGLDGEDADQTADLPFVNGKAYSYYPEITTVQLRGDWDWAEGTNLTLQYSNIYYGVLDLSSTNEDQEFKLVINGGGDESDGWAGWIGTNNVEYDPELDNADWFVLTGDSDNDNLKLKHSQTEYATYEVYAIWQPNMQYYKNWMLSVSGIDKKQPVGIETINANDGRQPVYNLSGQRVNNVRKGLYIIGGKKVVVK